MLMVVFGAGASYDSAPSHPPTEQYFTWEEHRMPLADQLFDNRREFVRALSQFPRCFPIVRYLRNRGDGITVERVLQGLQEEAKEYPERYRQLAAVRYYLHVMLWECEDRWTQYGTQGVTNQITLLDQIERWRNPDEQVCLVTFNYDTMLETALRTVGVEIKSMPDYVADHRYKFIKLHGSVNWGRRVEATYELLQQGLWPLIETLIDHADQLEITQHYTLVGQYPIHATEVSVLFPALAIPVESKLDFECPEQHLEALHAAIAEVDKLLVIGWRAAETPFLDLLAQSLQLPVEALVVAGDSDAANDTADRMKAAGVTGLYKQTDGGFTDLVVNRRADNFLRH
jgi:hypothetical protein